MTNKKDTTIRVDWQTYKALMMLKLKYRMSMKALVKDLVKTGSITREA